MNIIIYIGKDVVKNISSTDDLVIVSYKLEAFSEYLDYSQEEIKNLILQQTNILKTYEE